MGSTRPFANTFLCYQRQTGQSNASLNSNLYIIAGTSMAPFFSLYIIHTLIFFFFFYYLNSNHSSIKFTCEKQNDNQLTFFQTLWPTKTIFHTNICRKPTLAGFGLHFLSFSTYIYNISSVKALITRAYNLCKNWTAFHNEMLSFKNFTTNGYQLQMFHKITKFTKQQALSCKTRPCVKLPYMDYLAMKSGNKNPLAKQLPPD